jgi:hypothetical protein
MVFLKKKVFPLPTPSIGCRYWLGGEKSEGLKKDAAKQIIFPTTNFFMPEKNNPGRTSKTVL